MKQPATGTWSAPTSAHVEEAARRLVEKFDPLRIIVFGSYARDEVERHSDIDLLVVVSEVEDERQAAIGMLNVLNDLGAPTDVHVTTPEEIERRGWIKGTLLREALTEGREIYRKEDTHA